MMIFFKKKIKRYKMKKSNINLILLMIIIVLVIIAFMILIYSIFLYDNSIVTNNNEISNDNGSNDNGSNIKNYFNTNQFINSICSKNQNVNLKDYEIDNLSSVNNNYLSELLNLCLNVTSSSCPNNNFERPRGIFGMKKIEILLNKNISSLTYALWNNDYLYFIFSGTTTKLELIEDVEFSLIGASDVLRTPNNVKCSKGFLQTYQAIQKHLKEIRLEHMDKKLIISGHSLGGALSNICSLDFREENPINISYASPRVGNIAYANYFDKNIKSLRINNTSDIVPNLPFAITFNNIYQHTNTNIPFTLNLGSWLQNHIDAYKIGVNNLDLNCLYEQDFSYDQKICEEKGHVC